MSSFRPALTKVRVVDVSIRAPARGATNHGKTPTLQVKGFNPRPRTGASAINCCYPALISF